MSGLKTVNVNNGKVLEMEKQLEQAKTDEDRQRIANSDLYMVATIDDKDIFYHEAIWVKVNEKPIPTGMLVYHLDGNPMNNDSDNLGIVRENIEHGDLHKESNKIFHEHNIQNNKQFIKDNFRDIYDVIQW